MQHLQRGEWSGVGVRCRVLGVGSGMYCSIMWCRNKSLLRIMSEDKWISQYKTPFFLRYLRSYWQRTLFINITLAKRTLINRLITHLSGARVTCPWRHMTSSSSHWKCASGRCRATCYLRTLACRHIFRRRRSKLWSDKGAPSQFGSLLPPCPQHVGERKRTFQYGLYVIVCNTYPAP